MIELKGSVSKIAFRNNDTGFTVFTIKTRESPLPVTCTGSAITISENENVILKGDWESHKRFGKQFAITSYECVQPDTTEEIHRLLSSGLIPNIGPVRGKAIVEKFGISTIEILDSSPERLSEVTGIGPKTQAKIIEQWKKHRYLRNLTLFLQGFDISLNFIYKIGKVFGSDAKRLISENPYILIDNIRGIGFIKADTIAQKMGYAPDSAARIRAGVIFTLQESLSDGHVCLPMELLINKASDLLHVSSDLVTTSINTCSTNGEIVNENGFVYIRHYYKAEKSVAESIRRRIDFFKHGSRNRFNEKEILAWLDSYESRNGWQADPVQKSAIVSALRNPLLILTGGPGTGKTTILKVIVSFFKDKSLTVTLAAPTGRAAERMSSVTGIESKTIHRLLEYKPDTSESSFQKNETNQLDTAVIVIDEFSMVDLQLMKHLLAAVPINCTMLLIGDNNQLPSVGAGNVLADLLSCKTIPHVHLSKVFRQAASSRIVTVAHEIIEGTIPAFTNSKDNDCFFIEKADPTESAECIAELVSRRLPEKFGFNPFNDIQVISPMHKGMTGTLYLNTLLQEKLNKDSRKIVRGSNSFCVGDKVMQIRNNYDTGIFNGDIGIIKSIVNEADIIIDFNGTEIEYNQIMLDEIQSAYCISIHKSQGSEYNAVIIPVSTQHYVMLQRNLLYTALTRAKKLCVLVGTRNALSIAIKNNKALQRYSRLSDRLSNLQC